jgi:hypothetical protein
MIPGTVKPVQVALVEPVVYPKPELIKRDRLFVVHDNVFSNQRTVWPVQHVFDLVQLLGFR